MSPPRRSYHNYKRQERRHLLLWWRKQDRLVCIDCGDVLYGWAPVMGFKPNPQAN